MDKIAVYEHELLQYAISEMKKIGGIRFIGTAKEKAGVVAFVIEGVHPQDLGTILDKQGVAIRTGHHCCQPLHRRHDLTATARVSFSIYNTYKDVDIFIAAIKKAKDFLL